MCGYVTPRIIVVFTGSRFWIPALFQQEGDIPHDVWFGNQTFLFIAHLCRTDHRGITMDSSQSPLLLFRDLQDRQSTDEHEDLSALYSPGLMVRSVSLEVIIAST